MTIIVFWSSILLSALRVIRSQHFDGNWGACKTSNLSDWAPHWATFTPPTEYTDWRDCGVLDDMAINAPISQIRILGTDTNQHNWRDRFKAPSRITGLIGNSNALCTLMMYDLDAGSRAESRVGMEAVHWLVVNIPEQNLAEGRIEGGNVWVEYLPPDMRNGTSFHRYVVLIYAQHSSLEQAQDPYPMTKPSDSCLLCYHGYNPPCPNCSDQELADLTVRLEQSAKTFAVAQGLQGPIGGTFVLLDYDAVNGGAQLSNSQYLCLFLAVYILYVN